MKNPRRGGGPRTEAGKRAAAPNALKCGIAAVRWYDGDEQAQFDNLVAQLHKQYPQATIVVRMMIIQLATNWVKLERLENIDNGQQELARQLAHEVNAQLEPAPGAPADLAAPSPAVLALRRSAALPSAERMQNVERYRTLLERKVLKLIEQIEKTYAPQPATAGASASASASASARASGFAPSAPPDISDAIVVEHRPTP